MLTRRQLLTGAAACCLTPLVPGAHAVPGHEVRPWKKGKSAPVLDAVDLEDRPWLLAEQRGRIVLLNFWATWCEPCVAEMASLDALSSAGQVMVVGVNYKQTAPAIKAYAALHPVSYALLRDSSGEAFKRWTDGVLPTTVLVDARGVPRCSVVGEVDWVGPDAARVIDAVRTAR
ncbi:hypothetical protein BH10PSE17_BH10PSE17_08580 [soil metagenome]